jgi:hypothetical protein
MNAIGYARILDFTASFVVFYSQVNLPILAAFSEWR